MKKIINIILAIILAISLLFLVTIKACSQNAVYVQVTGNDLTGNGTVGNPFASLFKASQVATTPGTTIYISQGNYYEPHQCNIATGVNITGNGARPHLIMTYFSTSISGAINLLSGTLNTNGNQTISNLEIDGHDSGSIGIVVRLRGNVPIHDCKIHNFLGAGAFFFNKPSSAMVDPGTYALNNSFYNDSVIDCHSRASTAAGGGDICISGQQTMRIHDNYFSNIGRAQGKNGNWLGAVQGFNKGIRFDHNYCIGPNNEGGVFNIGIESWYNEGGWQVDSNTLSRGGCLFDLSFDARKGAYPYSIWFHHNKCTVTGGNPVYPLAGGNLSMGVQYENQADTLAGDGIIEYNTFHYIATPFAIQQVHGTQETTKRVYFRYNQCDSNGYTVNTSGANEIFLTGTASLPKAWDSIFIYNNNFIGYPSGLERSALFESVNYPYTGSNVFFKNNICENMTPYGYITLDGSGTIDKTFAQNNISFNNAFSNNVFFRTISVTASQIIAGVTYKIVTVGSTNWVAIGAASNTVGVTFVSTGVGSGSGTATYQAKVTNFTNTGTITSDPLFDATYHLKTGSPAISGGLNPPNTYIGAYSPSLTATSIVWATPPAITYGTGLSTQLNASVSPSVPGTFFYNYSLGAILPAGPDSLKVTFVPTDQTTYLSCTGFVILTVNKATLVINVTNTSKAYDSLPQGPTITTIPSGISTSILINGIGSLPINVGSYSYTVAGTNSNYTPSTQSGTFTITKRLDTIIASNQTVVYTGSPITVAFNTKYGLYSSLSYNYLSGHTNPGTCLVVITETNANSQAPPDTITLTIVPQPAVIKINNATQVFTGGSLPTPVTTTPNSLAYTITYNASSSVPQHPGTFIVIATLSSPYSGADTETYITVKATPSVPWATPSPITYGTLLSGTQLDAVPSVAGTGIYTPASGTLLNAGAQLLKFDFTPTDTADYNSVLGTTVTLTVNKATDTLSYYAPSLNQIYDGLPKPVIVNSSISGLTVITTTYNSSTTVPTGISSGSTYSLQSILTNSNYQATTITGTLTISPNTAAIQITNYSGLPYTGSGITVTVTCPYSFDLTFNGSHTLPIHPGNYTVIGTINDGIHTGADTVTMTIIKAGFTITWPNPADIVFGNALGGSQLNATYPVPGSAVYTPGSGTILNAGSAQPLTVKVTPTDTADYNVISKTVFINVTQALAHFAVSDTAQYYDGTGKSLIINTVPSLLGVVSVTYDGSGSLPSSIGPHTAIINLTNANYYAIPDTVILTILQPTAAISISNYIFTYDSSPKPVTVTSSYTFSLTYGGSGTAPTNATTGIQVIATITDGIHFGADTVTEIINQAPTSITWAQPAQMTDQSLLGSAQLDATGSVSGIITYVPGAGTIVSSPSITVTATLTPTSANYLPSTKTITITVAASTTNPNKKVKRYYLGNFYFVK